MVREWLLGVTGAAVLAALADSLMPPGGVKQVGRLVCGLVLLLAVLRPFAGVEVTNLLGQLEYDREALQRQSQQLQEETDARMKTIIEERMAAYSMDKAAELGVVCQVEVVCCPDGEGAFLPESAIVKGTAGTEERQVIQEILTEELGIPVQSVTFSGEEAP